MLSTDANGNSIRNKIKYGRISGIELKIKSLKKEKERTKRREELSLRNLTIIKSLTVERCRNIAEFYFCSNLPFIYLLNDKNSSHLAAEYISIFFNT